MKLLYITTLDHAKELLHWWHAIELGDGKVLACVRWTEELSEMQWSDHPDVMKLPHPVFEATVPLAEEHVTHLSRQFAVKSGDNIHHLLKEAAKRDPWMRLHVL